MLNENAIVITGPASSGKTTVLSNNNLMKEIINKVSEKSHCEKKSKVIVNFERISEEDYDIVLKKQKIIYHYDFLKNQSVFLKKFKKISKIFINFKSSATIICVAKRNTLYERYLNMENFRRKHRKLIKYLNPKVLYILNRVPRLYKSKKKIVSIYCEFLDYINIFNTNIFIFDTNKNLLIKTNKQSAKKIIKNIVYS